MTTVSEWLRPGVYMAMCGTCTPYGVFFENRKLRDMWVTVHWIRVGHVTSRIDGPEK